ncbi:GTPase-activating protein [Spiromyces aspiralis]|uniref:GTPase-activating protein n=1 Tax=Spiromyces aspiralis TaxID=68401 RepID=A0ACC1HX96_9FUNG|nr:GTPase-activating protein [Spiromyces aspiralis]
MPSSLSEQDLPTDQQADDGQRESSQELNCSPSESSGKAFPTTTRLDKFLRVLGSTNVDLDELRKLSWNGIPHMCRPMAWQLLMAGGYLPCNANRRDQTLLRKRKEYSDWARRTFSKGESALDSALWHQISIDVPRTVPVSKLFRHEPIQKARPFHSRQCVAGYVQGINDLVTPFYMVFLSSYLEGDPEKCNPDGLSQSIINDVEADSFWCLTKLLDGIQDNYTHAQPGIQRQLVKLKDLVSRINEKLTRHLESQGLEFIQFAFRWINCLLVREFSLANTIRMWDTYLAEPSGYSEFHIYVCAAFLLRWADTLLKMDFQDLILFLQSPPTSDWTHKDIELVLSEAYMLKCLYHSAPKHLDAPTR